MLKSFNMNEQSQNAYTWRVMIDNEADGAWNMALDEAIAACAGDGKSPPTLRLYRWSPGCLSLGRAQPFSDINLSGVEENGWQIVRRPSGGRAILHIDELTYSFAAPLENPLFSGGILESYQRIANGLIDFLNRLGISADMNHLPPASSKDEQNPICFEVPSQYEITWHGKKIIGSAQARKGNQVLQHGSIPVFGDITRIVDGLNYPNKAAKHEAQSAMVNRAVTLKEAAGRDFSWQELMDAFLEAQAFVNGLSLSWGAYTPEELSLAQELKSNKYAASIWNERI